MSYEFKNFEEYSKLLKINTNDIKKQLIETYTNIIEFYNNYDITDFDKVIKKDISNNNVINDFDDYYKCNNELYIVTHNNKVVGFFINQQNIYDNIILSYEIDWTKFIKQIILDCEDLSNYIYPNYDINSVDINGLYLSINNNFSSFFIDICEEYFNGIKFINNIFIPKTNYDSLIFYDCNKINIDLYHTPQRNDINKICSFTESFTVINYANKIDTCKCIYEDYYYIIFKKPILIDMYKHKRTDIFMNLKIIVGSNEYNISQKELDENNIDTHNKLRFNKLSTLNISNSKLILLFGIQLINPLKINLKDRRIYNVEEYEYISKICQNCVYKYGGGCGIYVNNDIKCLSKFIFNTKCIKSKKINIKYLYSKFNICKNINNFIPKTFIVKEQKIIKKDNNGYVYINHLREHVNNKENIYKIGRTQQDGDKRLKQYPKGTIQKIKLYVNDCVACEKELIKTFDVKFEKMKEEYGDEYYRGLYNDMEKMFKYIADKYKSTFLLQH